MLAFQSKPNETGNFFQPLISLYIKMNGNVLHVLVPPLLAQQYLAIKMVLQELSWEMQRGQQRSFTLTLYCVHCNYHMKIVAGELKTTWKTRQSFFPAFGMSMLDSQTFSFMMKGRVGQAIDEERTSYFWRENSNSNSIKQNLDFFFDPKSRLTNNWKNQTLG